MGFFQDLKEDLSQAVNELMPEEILGEEELQENTEDKDKKQNVTAESQEKEIMIDPAELEQILKEDSKEEVKEQIEAAPISQDIIAGVEEALSRDMQEDEVEEIEEIEEPVETGEEKIEETKKIEEVKESGIMEETKKVQTEKTKPGFGINKKDQIKEKENKQESKGERKMTESAKLTGVATDETAVITAGMTINGDIMSKGSMDILGTINGNVETLGKLEIAGNINGDSKAAEIYADSANITGEVRSDGAIKIGQSSVVIGNVFATSAVIAGAVKGDIDVKGPVILDTTAIVMGNIKSKSVQINNGAVIEGLCSQCYADVNPTAFFEDLKKKK